MSSLFDDITKGIKEGITVVADKTDELTKIGRLKVEILSVKRNIEKKFTELGGRVYHVITVDKVADIDKDEEVKRMVAELGDLEQKLNEKNAEIENVKETKEAERKEREEAKKREKEEAQKEEPEVVEVEAVEVEEVPPEGKSKKK
jgi:GTPase involved in cell partitioning and DNA repair